MLPLTSKLWLLYKNTWIYIYKILIWNYYLLRYFLLYLCPSKYQLFLQKTIFFTCKISKFARLLVKRKQTNKQTLQRRILKHEGQSQEMRTFGWWYSTSWVKTMLSSSSTSPCHACNEYIGSPFRSCSLRGKKKNSPTSLYTLNIKQDQVNRRIYTAELVCFYWEFFPETASLSCRESNWELSPSLTPLAATFICSLVGKFC